MPVTSSETKVNSSFAAVSLLPTAEQVRLAALRAARQIDFSVQKEIFLKTMQAFLSQLCRTVDSFGVKIFCLESRCEKLYENIYATVIDGKSVIIKTFKTRLEVEEESATLNKLKTVACVPKVIEVSKPGKGHFIVMTRATGVDLCEYLQNEGILEETEARAIMIQLLCVLADIHKAGVVHGDIKDANLVYDERTGTISVIDFERDKQTAQCRSPEQVRGKTATAKTDLWSAGLLLYTMLTGDDYFGSDTEVQKKKIKFTFENPELNDFLECLVDRDITSRYDADQALNHPWICGCCDAESRSDEAGCSDEAERSEGESESDDAESDGESSEKTD